MDLTKIPGANDQHLIHVQWHSDALAVSVCCTLAETNPTNSCKSTVNLRLWVIFHRETEMRHNYQNWLRIDKMKAGTVSGCHQACQISSGSWENRLQRLD